MSSKKKSLRAAEQDRPDVKAQRQAWREKTAGLDLHRLVFLDESGAKTNMTRLYGRSFDGERVVDATPQGHWCTTTVLSAMRGDVRDLHPESTDAEPAAGGSGGDGLFNVNDFGSRVSVRENKRYKSGVLRSRGRQGCDVGPCRLNGGLAVLSASG